MTTSADVELVRRAWQAFASGNVDAAAAALDPNVHWYGAEEPHADGSCHSRVDAIAFMRQALVS